MVIFFKVRLFLLDRFLVNGRVGHVRISFPLSSVLGSWSWDVDKEEGGAIFGCQEKGTRCLCPGRLDDDTSNTNVGALNIVLDTDDKVHYLLCLLGTLLLGI